MKKGISKLLTIATALMLSASVSIVAYAATGSTSTLSIIAGKAETVTLPADAADIMVANPAVADTMSLRTDQLYVLGRTVGDTNIIAFDAQGKQIANIAVSVGADDETLRKALKELFPGERVEARSINNTLVLRGKVSTPAVANQVRDLASRFISAAATNRTLVDLMSVRGEQQVMLKVKVLEVRRDLLREMGVEIENFDLGIGNRTTTGLTTAGLFGISAEQFGTGVIGLAQRGNFGPLDLNISGLETDGLLNTLAEPTLTAISGESAGFLAGGEFPIPAARDNQGNVTLEFRQFGVSLNFVPTVLSEDRISLQLSSEVSERSDADGVVLQGLTIPGLAVRRAQTTVQMGSGGTLLIAGLLRSTVTQGLNGLPGFKDIPILGELFKSRSFQRGESELVFLVTPYLVEPFADQQADLATRNDNDLLHSILETGKEGKGEPVTAPATLPRSSKPSKAMPIRMQPPVKGERLYRRQGEESRTAGEKKAELNNEIWRPRHLRGKPAADGTKLGALNPIEGAPEVIADPAEQAALPPDHPALMLPVGKGKQAAIDIPLPSDDALPMPRRKPVMGDGSGEHRKSAKAEMQEETVKKAEVEAVKAETLAAVEPAAGDIVLQAPLPRRKPVERMQAKALSNTFMNSLKKIYGNRVSAKLGEGQSYGYIVD